MSEPAAPEPFPESFPESFPEPYPEPYEAPSSRPSTPITIDVNGVSKSFNIDSEPATTLKDRVLAISRRGRREEKSNSAFHALSDVSFQVHEGETFGILGHNGSGKSTLLKVMAGTIRPSGGRVLSRGRLSALLELGAGFHPDLSGKENIYLNASILGIPRQRVDEIFEEIVEFAGLEDFIHLQVKYYSSGMQGRLGFAVATNLDPDILLIDEVLAVGDEAFQAKCMERVFGFKQLGHTMVIVSHGTEQVRQLCDRVAVLEKGKLLFVGDPDEAIEIYRAALHGPKDADRAPVVEVKAIMETSDDAPAVAITECKVLGKPASGFISPGDWLTVVLRFTVNQPIEHNIRLIVATLDGNVMMSRSIVDTLGYSLPGELGENEARFELGPIPLLDGHYQVTAMAESLATAEVHHRVPNMTDFHVQGPGHGYGRVDIPTTCEVKRGQRPPQAIIDIDQTAAPTTV